MYPATPVFLVERCNERTIRKTPTDPCGDPTCTRSAEGWDDTVFDVRRTDTGLVLTTDQAFIGHGLPPGAMYWADMRGTDRPTGPDDWAGRDLRVVRDSFARFPSGYPLGASAADPTLPKRSPSHLFADGPQLVVILPNRQPWNIDSRASNCTMPYDYEHRCWVRHGEPPNVTVDKNGLTCAAGAGSIQSGDYHGFLQNGVLTAG